MKTRVIKWLISHFHATRMMTKLNQKRHAHLGFYYEFEDIGNLSKHERVRRCSFGASHQDEGGLQIYSDYGPSAEGGLLSVFRDIPEVEPVGAEQNVWFGQAYLPLSTASEIAFSAIHIRHQIDKIPNDWRPHIEKLLWLAELALGCGRAK